MTTTWTAEDSAALDAAILAAYPRPRPLAYDHRIGELLKPKPVAPSAHCVGCGTPLWHGHTPPPGMARHDGYQRCPRCFSRLRPKKRKVVTQARTVRVAAVMELTGRGLTARQIADRLSVTERTVQRYRSKAVA